MTVLEQKVFSKYQIKHIVDDAPEFIGFIEQLIQEEKNALLDRLAKLEDRKSEMSNMIAWEWINELLENERSN